MSGPRGAVVIIGGEEFHATESDPFVFGRTDADGVVGLNPDDMGISAEAGSIEFSYGLWWAVNRSSKRRLLIEGVGGVGPQTLKCGARQALTAERIAILVPGAVHTHRLEVIVPPECVAQLRMSARQSSGTLTTDDIVLPDKDRQVMTALAAGYLRPFPRHDPRPLSYDEAASMLGAAWTPTTVRKQIERLRERLAAKRDLYFEGPHAKDELCRYLIEHGVLSASDLTDLEGVQLR